MPLNCAARRRRGAGCEAQLRPPTAPRRRCTPAGSSPTSRKRCWRKAASASRRQCCSTARPRGAARRCVVQCGRGAGGAVAAAVQRADRSGAAALRRPARAVARGGARDEAVALLQEASPVPYSSQPKKSSHNATALLSGSQFWSIKRGDQDLQDSTVLTLKSCTFLTQTCTTRSLRCAG